jgi:hypothetical protein
LITDIALSSPFLKGLKMVSNTNQWNDVDAQAMSESIRQLHSLDDLDIHHYDHRVMAPSHIAGFSKLRYLIIDSLDGVVLQPPSRPSPVLDMQLGTTMDSPLNFHHLLSMLCPSQLQTLYLTMHGTSASSSSLAHWKLCFDTLSVYSLHTLQVIFISIEEIPTEAADLAIFRPLLAIRTLKTLVIRGFRHTLGDDDLEQMALAWPQLEDIALYDGTPTSATTPCSRITMNGIATLLKHCPMLSTLGLTIDASTTHPQFISNHVGVRNEAITTIIVGNSLIGNPVEVARSLYRILPNLTKVKMWRGDGTRCLATAEGTPPPHAPDYHSWWIAVLQILETLRREGRNNICG